MAGKSAVDSALGSIIGVKNQVSDTTIITGLWISGVVGVAVILLFCVLQRVSLLYRYRLVANHVRVKPPKLRERGLISFIDWAIKSISVSDVDFILSAGLDALVMVKICALGVQLFLPLCILGVIVLVPLHWTGGASKHLDAYHSGFMRLTMSNIPQGSRMFWVHMVFVYIYLGWAMVLLRWHYQQYLTIRQHYLRKGDDVNRWRELYEEPASDKERIEGLLRSLPLVKAFIPSGVPTSPGTAAPAQDQSDEEELYSLGDMSPSGETRWMPAFPEGVGSPRTGPSRHSTDGIQGRVVRRSGVLRPHDSLNGTRGTSPQAICARGTSSAGGAEGGPRSSTAHNPSRRFVHRAVQSIGPRTARHSLHHQLSLGGAPSTSKKTAMAQELTSWKEPSRGHGPYLDGDWQGGPKTSSAVGAACNGGGGGSSSVPVAEATEGPELHKEADTVAVAAAAGPSASAFVRYNAAMPPPPQQQPRRSPQPSPLHPSRLSLQLQNTADVTMRGLGWPASGESAGATEGGEGLSLAPRPASICRAAETQLNPDAHLLAWWLDRREVAISLSGKSGGEQQPEEPGLPQGCGLRKQQQQQQQQQQPADGDDATESNQVGMDIERPSVSHRKTVNAEYSDGRRVAVLAQHYAVLVTDVVERRAGRGRHISGKVSARSEVAVLPGAPASEAVSVELSSQRQGGCLPRWLRSWCDFQYGKQAARKLNPNLRTTLSEDMMEERNRVVNRTPHKGSSLAYGSCSHRPHLALTSLGNDHLTPSLYLGTGTCNASSPPQPLSASFNLRSAAARDDLGGQVSYRGSPFPPHRAGGPASLGQSPGVVSGGRKATAAGGGAGRGGGERLIRLLEMMGREAHKLAARSAAAGHASARNYSTSHTGAELPGPAPSETLRAATLPTAFFATGATQRTADGLQPRSLPQAGAAAAGGTSELGSKGSTSSVRGGAALVLEDLGPAAIFRTAVEERQEDQKRQGRGPTASRSGTAAGPVAEGTEVRQEVECGKAADATGGGGNDSGIGSAGCAVDASGASADGAADECLPAAAVDAAAHGQHQGPADGEVEGSGESARKRRLHSAALAGWEAVRRAVRDGRVAQLPWLYRYSVVSATFLRLFPEEFDRAIQVINFKEVDLLLMSVDRHMAQYEYAIKYEETTGKPLFGRIGFCRLAGARHRLREYHRDKINELLHKVREARRTATNTATTQSWFVFFRTQRAAAMASQCIIHGEDNRQFRVHPAPGPDEVNWSALWSNFRERDLRRNLMRPLVVLMVTFPIGIFTGGLTQLDYLLCPAHHCASLERGTAAWVAANCTDEISRRESQQLSWEWYCGQKDFVARLLKRLVVAWLPSLLLILWQGMVLPLFFTFVVQISRQARSLSEADRCIAKNMFYFGVFNVFLGGVAGSTIIQGINSAIEKGPSEIFNLIGTYVPTSSNFFINYTMFRVFVSVPLRMLWPHIGIRMYLIRRYLRFSCIITKREQAFLMAPVSPRYGFEVGMVMIIFLVAFAFSVISPLLLAMALLFFAISWLFWRWALLYVYARKYEGGGTMWPFVFNRVMVCMAIFPVFTSCVFITKHAYMQAIVLLVTVPIALIRFHKYCYYRFETGLKAMPLEAAVAAPPARVEPWVYTPPPLLKNLAGWHPDWPKSWMGWNMPVMYG